MHLPDGVGPQVFLIPIRAPNDEGAVEMGSGSDVPGVAGQGAHAETAHVMYEIGDNIFDDFQGEPCRRR